MSEEKNENPNQPQQQQESEQKPEEEQQMDNPQEPPIKRIFNHEKVLKYYKDQHPPTRREKFIDQLFPPIIDSLHDRSNKNTGQDRINVQEIDWKKASELFPKLCLFPINKIKV